MSNRLLLKSSGTAGAVPDFDDLELAELVVNTRNGKLFCKTYDGATYAIVDLTLSSPDEIIASGQGLIGRSASGSGPAELLTTTQSRSLLNVADGADATGFRGNVTDTQMLALSSPVAGQWVHNTDYGYAKYVYNGTFWLGPTDFVFINKTGASSVLSKTCKVSSAQDFAIANPGAEDSVFVIGTVRTAGVADGGSVVVTLNSKPRKALMQANDDTIRGYILFTYANGECYSVAGTGNNTGGFGIALESKNNAGAAYEVWYVPIVTEIY